MKLSPLSATLSAVVFLAGWARAAEPSVTRTFGASELSPRPIFSPETGFGFDLGTAPSPSGEPFYFSVRVPEGNYAVEVALGGPESSVTTVKAESRQLMLEGIAVGANQTQRHRFLVNVRVPALPPPQKNAPGGDAVRLTEREQGYLRWDDKLTLEFNGERPSVQEISITPVELPTLFLLGDSTVTDQNFEPGASWGQMVPRFLRSVVVANHAESGETMKSFITELRLAKVLSQVKPGDSVALQFGHNDQKRQWPQTYVEASTTYKAYLRLIIEEVRLRQATPILVTSVQRRTFDEQGKIRNTHGAYLDAVRDVAKEQGVALVDLADFTARLYEALGPTRAPLAFSDGGKDATHHNNYGAYVIALGFLQGLKVQGSPLAEGLSSDFPGIDPARPPAPEEFRLPASPLRNQARPRGD